jgi:DNA-directed RNA polymerase subunit H (RpoH/RPB5)
MSSYRISTLYNSRINILELLEMEGYAVQDYQGFSKNEIDAMFKHDQLDMLVSRENNQKVYIKYSLGKPIRKELLSQMIEDLFENEYMNTNAPLLQETDTLVIIIDEEPNETNIKQCRLLFDRFKKFVVMFNIRRLQFNIRKHVLIPQTRILSTVDMANLKTKYKIKDWSQLPEISRFDPLAMSVFLRPGQIIEIDRHSPVSISNLYYRFCS